jgi:hypothetical protein
MIQHHKRNDKFFSTRVFLTHHLTQKKLFEFSLIKKTILDIHNELIKWGSGFPPIASLSKPSLL